MKAMLSVFVFLLAPIFCFGMASASPEQIQRMLDDEASEIAGGNKFTVKLELKEQASAESNMLCLAFLDKLEVSKLTGTAGVTLSKWKSIQGRGYRIVDPDYGTKSRERFTTEEFRRSVQYVDYKISGCKTTCGEKQISFSKFEPYCESKIELTIVKMRDIETGTYSAQCVADSDGKEISQKSCEDSGLVD